MAKQNTKEARSDHLKGEGEGQKVNLRLTKKQTEKLLDQKGKKKTPRPRIVHYQARVRCGRCGKWRTAWTGDKMWYQCPDCGHQGCRAVKFNMSHQEEPCPFDPTCPPTSPTSA